MIDNIVKGVLNEPEKIATVKVSRGWFMPDKEVDLVITGVTLGTLARISTKVNKMMVKSDKGWPDRAFHFIEANTKQLIDVVALGIHNKKGDPPKWLYDVLENNFSVDELKQLFDRIYRRLDLTGFFHIMGSVRTLDVLSDTPETEVSKPQSEA